MDSTEIYELVYDAVKQALADENAGGQARISRRMEDGELIFRDSTGKDVKVMPMASAFKKITSVREKLRMIEQRINNHPSLSTTEKAELQVYLTRSYGSLTSFNFLFRNANEGFKGTGGSR